MLNKILNRISSHVRCLKEKRKTFKNWWMYYFHYFLRYGERIFHTRSGDKFYVRCHSINHMRSDFLVIIETYLYRQYTKEFDVGKDDIIVDIGAYIGDFTVYAAKKAINGKVYAFEPFPESFKQLNKNLSLNNLKNVYAYEEGVSGKTGVKQLYLTEWFCGTYTTTSEFLSLKRYGHNRVVDVKVITIDDIFKRFNLQKIDFLKIDCEGEEYEILFNTSKDSFKKIEKIAMELHKCSNYTFEDMIDFLNVVGYSVSWNKDISKDSDVMTLYAQRK